jgi:PKD repeat protein
MRNVKQLCIGKIFTLLLLNFIISNNVLSQISHGGLPVGLSRSNSTSSLKSVRSERALDFSIPKFKLPKINNDSLLARDMAKEDYRKGFNFAHIVATDLNINNSGSWSETLDEKIWSLEISSENANSLSLLLDFKLNPGAKLFIYNPTTKQVLGSYTSKNNKEAGGLLIQPLGGEKAILEYHIPKDADKGILAVKGVGHGYLKSFDEYTPQFEGEYTNFGRSESCAKDINSDIGKGWQNVKRSVVRIIIQRDANLLSSSTGTLVNNTKQDGKPYILTCEHSINGWSRYTDYTPHIGAKYSIYFFNYESLVIGEDGDQSQSISSATLKATKTDLDFALLELSQDIPQAYKPYYAGWEITQEPFDFAACISHPKGDVKKITKNLGLNRANQTFNTDYGYKENTHFDLEGWKYGGIEGGSSGSALFNSEHRLTGTLSGGSLDCEAMAAINPWVGQRSEKFEMLFHCWEDSEVPSQQLKHWLDSEGSGVSFLDGYDPNPENKLYFYPNTDLCYQNEDVIFTDHSIGNYTNYRWNFGENANPQTAQGKDPISVQFLSIGKHTVSLTATNESGQDVTITYTDYIEVYFRPAHVEFEADKRAVSRGETVTFTNLCSGSNTLYEWDFGVGATPQTVSTSSKSDITVTYNSLENQGDVKLTARNPIQDETVFYIAYISIGEVLDGQVSFSILDDAPYFIGDEIRVKSDSDYWSENSFTYTYYWYKDGNLISNQQKLEENIVFNTIGEHKIEFTVSSSYDSETVDKTVTIYEHIKASPKVEIINYNLLSFSVANGKNDESYEWDFGDGSTASGENVEHEFSNIGTFKVCLTSSNSIETKKNFKTIEINTVATGIDDDFNNNQIELSIYPNPAYERVNLVFPSKFTGETQIKIISLTGRVVYSNKTQDKQFTIPCNQLSKGLLMVMIQNETQVITHKVIIK